MMPINAYMVAALTGTPPTGKIFLNAVCAPNETLAVAMAMWLFMKEAGPDVEPLSGINVMPLDPGFMRAALNGGEAEIIPFSIVPNKPPEVPAGELAAREADDKSQGLVPAQPIGERLCTCKPQWSEDGKGFSHADWCLKNQLPPGPAA